MDFPDIEKELADWLFPDSTPVDLTQDLSTRVQQLEGTEGFEAIAALESDAIGALSYVRKMNQGDPLVLVDLYWGRLPPHVSVNEIRDRVRSCYGREGFMAGRDDALGMVMRKGDTTLHVFLNCTPPVGREIRAMYLTVSDVSPHH